MFKLRMKFARYILGLGFTEGGLIATEGRLDVRKTFTDGRININEPAVIAGCDIIVKTEEKE